MSRRLGGWLAAAGVLAVLALGLPWSAEVAGTGAPARVAIAGSIVLGGLAVAQGRDRLLPVAVLVGAAGVVVGGVSPSPGRLALAAAVFCLAAGLRAEGRRVLPGR